ncbi:MAG TPA: hypothetical protein P5154_04525 [Candidatus Izemoplasmatales bacterium]|nr:hypothetical protein [Candidatus Izemoplasmatales bacterium]
MTEVIQGFFRHLPRAVFRTIVSPEPSFHRAFDIYDKGEKKTKKQYRFSDQKSFYPTAFFSCDFGDAEL